jgi:hypothetical protein
VAESTPALFEVKTCRECGKTKPSDAFPPRGRKCRACHRVYAANYYRLNRGQWVGYAELQVERGSIDPDKRRQAERRRVAELRRSAETCSADGCARPLRSKSLKLCATHYRRHYRGTPGGAVRKRQAIPAGATCSLAGCAEPHEAHGLCKRHARAERHRLNPDEGRAAARRRRARKLKLPAEAYTLADLLARDGSACVLCGEQMDLTVRWPDRRSPSVEHLECLSWPDSPGDMLSNVAVSHLGCNNGRCNKPHPAAARKRVELLAAQEPADREATA